MLGFEYRYSRMIGRRDFHQPLIEQLGLGLNAVDFVMSERVGNLPAECVNNVVFALHHLRNIDRNRFCLNAVFFQVVS